MSLVDAKINLAGTRRWTLDNEHTMIINEHSFASFGSLQDLLSQRGLPASLKHFSVWSIAFVLFSIQKMPGLTVEGFRILTVITCSEYSDGLLLRWYHFFIRWYLHGVDLDDVLLLSIPLIGIHEWNMKDVTKNMTGLRSAGSLPWYKTREYKCWFCLCACLCGTWLACQFPPCKWALRFVCCIVLQDSVTSSVRIWYIFELSSTLL